MDCTTNTDRVPLLLRPGRGREQTLTRPAIPLARNGNAAFPRARTQANLSAPLTMQPSPIRPTRRGMSQERERSGRLKNMMSGNWLRGFHANRHQNEHPTREQMDQLDGLDSPTLDKTMPLGTGVPGAPTEPKARRRAGNAGHGVQVNLNDRDDGTWNSVPAIPDTPKKTVNIQTMNAPTVPRRRGAKGGHGVNQANARNDGTWIPTRIEPTPRKSPSPVPVSDVDYTRVKSYPSKDMFGGNGKNIVEAMNEWYDPRNNAHLHQFCTQRKVAVIKGWMHDCALCVCQGYEK